MGIGGLPRGSIVIERYVYSSANDKQGVQWLAQIVDEDGDLRLLEACATRHEALAVFAPLPRRIPTGDGGAQ